MRTKTVCIIDRRTHMPAPSHLYRMDVYSEFQRHLKIYGGYRRIAICQARYLLRFLETGSYFASQWFNERQILRHILSPTYTYNVWDMYVNLLRDPLLEDWVMDINHKFYTSVSSPYGLYVKIRYHKILPHGIYTWIVETGIPSDKRIVNSHNDLRHHLFFLCWKHRMRKVFTSLLLHPRIVDHLLVNEQKSIDSWIHLVESSERH